MLELIRCFYHAPLDGPSSEALAARARVRELFAGAPPATGGADLVPLPLGAEVWKHAIFRKDLADGALVPAILADRKAALFYYGLSAMDAPSREWLAADPARLSRLYLRHAEPWSVFARSLRIDQDRIVVPGGEAAAPLWQQLVGQSPQDPEAFIDKLLEKHDGRLAWLFDVVVHLPKPMQDHLLGADLLDADARLARLRAVADVFARVGPDWRLRESPMWRPLVDPALLLSELEVEPDGRLTGPRARVFWRKLFASDALPAAEAGARPVRRAKGSPPDVDVPFLLERVFLERPQAQRERLEQVLFVQRMARAAGTPADAEVLTVGRGFARFRALALSFERMGLDDVRVMSAALRRVERVTARAPAAALATFQALLACIERIRMVRVIDARQASSLVGSLAAEPFGDKRSASAIAATWLASALLPALARADGSAESQLIDAMAGVRSVTSAAAGQATRVTWEGHHYVVDAVVAEQQRLRSVRAAQSSASIDEALALCRAIAALRRPETAAFDDALASVDALAPRIVKRAMARVPDADVAGALPRARAAIEEAAGDARSGRPASRAAVKAARLLEFVADRVLAEALVATVYAAYLPADRSEFIAGRVDARHDFGLAAAAAVDRHRWPWALAEPQSGSGLPWRLRGSLLSLDLAFGQFLLRRVSDEAPSPRLNGSDRQGFLRNVVLLNAFDLDDEGRDRLVAAVVQGRARLDAATGRAGGMREIAARAGLSEWREHALTWSLQHDPAAPGAALSLVELFWLGAGADDTRALDAWGASLVGVTGQWSTRLPRARAWEDLTGHWGSGLLASQVVDLNIRTAQWLAEAGLPAALARGVLSAAVLEFVDQVPVGHPDDWPALVYYARALPTTRFEDYVATLTIDGPLRPVSPAEELP